MLKDWARRKKGAVLPTWTSLLEYASEFGLNPDDLGDTNMKWIIRWSLWKTAKASKDIWDIWYSRGNKGISGLGADAQSLRLWAMEKDDG